MARVLHLEDDCFALLAKSIAPPWDMSQIGAWHDRPAAWERQDSSGAPFEHFVVRCPRSDCEGCVVIHRLVFYDSRPADAVLCRLALALEQGEQHADSPLTASAVGGFHSDRAVWERAEIQATDLPARVSLAMAHVASVDKVLRGGSNSEEESELARARRPASTVPVEAWLNVSRGGDWNTLHTHPGSSYSASYYASAPAHAKAARASPEVYRSGHGGDAQHCQKLGEEGAVGGERESGEVKQMRLDAILSGRLVLFPEAPFTLSDAQAAQLAPSAPSTLGTQSEHASGREGDHTTTQNQAPRSLTHLVCDPVPGTLLVFPSFVPHFVHPILPDAVPGCEPMVGRAIRQDDVDTSSDGAESTVRSVHPGGRLTGDGKAVGSAPARVSLALNFD